MREEIVGLVPAAGKGLRLGLPYPKELYPVIRNNRYRPVAQFIVGNLTNADVEHIILVVNETKHQLMGFFGSGQRFGCHFSYVVQESLPAGDHSTSPGLAHALDAAYHLTCGKTVFFGMADTIMQPEEVFSRVYSEARPDDDLILALFPTEHPEKFGMVRSDENGRVQAIIDKPAQTDLTEMWGCIIWRPRFTDYLHTCVRQGVADFAQIINNAIAAGFHVRGVHLPQSLYIDLGTYEEILEMDRRLRIG
jgi:glucose-1-phosphate thymidylyltransferase